MRRHVWFVSILTFCAPIASGQQIDSQPVEIPAPVEKIMIPTGFDDNDNVEVVLHGHFPNTCFNIGKTSHKIDTENKKIVISASAYRYEGQVCAQTITPFMMVEKLGIVAAGTYEVKLETNSDLKQLLTVTNRTTESPDNFFYAPVSGATLEYKANNQGQTLTIRGQYPLTLRGCAKITEVKLLREKADILVVLPVMDFFYDETCEGHEIDYVKKVDVDQQLEEGLVHVRALHGQAFNNYVDLRSTK